VIIHNSCGSQECVGDRGARATCRLYGGIRNIRRIVSDDDCDRSLNCGPCCGRVCAQERFTVSDVLAVTYSQRRIRVTSVPSHRTLRNTTPTGFLKAWSISTRKHTVEREVACRIHVDA